MSDTAASKAVNFSQNTALSLRGFLSSPAERNVLRRSKEGGKTITAEQPLVNRPLHISLGEPQAVNVRGPTCATVTLRSESGAAKISGGMTAQVQDNSPKDSKVEAAMATLHLSPPVVSDTPKVPIRPRSEHQNALLNLFRKSSGPETESISTSNPNLESSSTPFELFALPSPGHPKEPSRAKESPRVQPTGDFSHILPISQSRRPQAVLRLRKSPVSATIDGPLNVPQFDMFGKKSKSGTDMSKNGIPEGQHKSPIPILSRLFKIQDSFHSNEQNDFTSMDQDAAAPLLAPATAPQGQATTPGTFQPQILRRPVHIQPLHQDSILSPIESLPSPKHNLTFDRRGHQTHEQKQSLLSFFSKPSPVVSPINACLTALISSPRIKSGSQSDHSGPSIAESMQASSRIRGCSGKIA